MHSDFCWIINFFGAALNCDSPILEALFCHFPVEPGYRVWSLVSCQNKEDLFDTLEKALIKKRWKIRQVDRSENRLFAKNNGDRQFRSIEIYIPNTNDNSYNLAISEVFNFKSWTIIFEQTWSRCLIYWNNHDFPDIGRNPGYFYWHMTTMNSIMNTIQGLSNFLNGQTTRCFSPSGFSFITETLTGSICLNSAQ